MPQASSLLQVIYLNKVKCPSPDVHSKCSAALTRDLTRTLDKLLSQGMEAKTSQPKWEATSAGLQDDQAPTPQSSGFPSSFSSSPPALGAGSPAIESSKPSDSNDVDFPFVGSVGQRLAYVARLSGWLAREGLLDVGTFADWALEQLEGMGTTLQATALLFALLTAFIPVSLKEILTAGGRECVADAAFVC